MPGGNHRPTASITDETFHTHGLCPVRGLNLGRSGVKQSELRRDESNALAHRATAAHSSLIYCEYEQRTLQKNGQNLCGKVLCEQRERCKQIMSNEHH